MPKFKRKEAIIDAIQWWCIDATNHNLEEIVKFIGDTPKCDRCYLEVLYIYQLNNVLKLRPGDWLIRDVTGGYYQCINDAFKLSYEPVIIPMYD